MADVDAIAIALEQAREAGTAIPRFTKADGALTVADAYAIQWRGIERRIAIGERVIGAKLGLTSEAKQQTMGVDEPIYGWLTDAMRHPSGEPLDLDRFIHPRVEPEIGFLLGEELRGPATVTGVLAATRAVFAALEVIDSRYTAFDFQLPDVVADNASASAASLICGSLAVPPHAAGDLSLTGCVIRRDGEVVHTAAGAAVLGHPAAAVAWLVDRLAERGQSLPAGSLVIAGALTDAVPIAAGQSISADFDGLGHVSVRA